MLSVLPVATWILQACILMMHVHGVASQSTPATCTDTAFIWSYNKESQTPCQMAANLGAECLGKNFSIPPLPPPQGAFHYTAPTPLTECGCNFVYYNLISCCAACQGGFVETLENYGTNCTTDFSPGVAPPDNYTAKLDIPQWAYMYPNPTFDVSAAQANASAAGAAPPAATGSSSAVPVTSGSAVHPSTTGAPSPTPPAAQGSNATNATSPQNPSVAPNTPSPSPSQKSGAVSSVTYGALLGAVLSACALAILL
ncbi:hypothetical protein PsYK624_111640 [Phanerochaete sordida]|uniref:Uncharacterized protein n=1 Tax=Phanerochaete sordida TaxID=48140 RepID=A0A9P3GG33_9APHY|nr:hypothetical protein PsYK624_111640 [Phanerochaete sordida]